MNQRGSQPRDGSGKFGQKPFRPRAVRPSPDRDTKAAAETDPIESSDPVEVFIRRKLVVRHGKQDLDAMTTHLEKSTATYRSAVLLARNEDHDNAVSLAHKSAHHAVDALPSYRACRLHPEVKDRHKGHVTYFEAELRVGELISEEAATELARKWQSALDVRNKETYRAFRVSNPKPEIDTARSVRRYCLRILGFEDPNDPKFP